MTAPGLQPFFSPGPRASILGTPPLGIQLQTPRIRFGNQLFQQHHRRFNKDFKRMHDMRRDRYPPREPFRAKMDEQHDANKINEEAAGNKPANAKDAAGSASPKTEDSSQTDEPDAKRRRLESENDDNLIKHSDAGESATSKSNLKGEDRDKETSECEGSGAQNLEHNAVNTEMLSTMSTLKVTIQQSSESRAISTSAPDSVTKGSEDSTEEMDSTSAKFICYICNANCYNQKNFQKHMNGTRHHQRLLEIQQMSNACLATMIPKSDGIGRGRESDKKRPRWCSTCQAYFRGNVIEHRRTPRHKVKLKRSSQDKDQAGQDDPEDLITVDAVGCFDEDDEEGMTEEDDDSISDCLSDRDSQALLSEFEKEPYDAEAVYGQEFVVPVTGFLCKLCHKFYHSESTARFTHCKSLMHFQNLQGYKAQRAQDCSSASAQDPAPSGVSSFGLTDDHKSGQKEVNTDRTSTEAAASEPETEELSANSEIQAPTLLGVDDAVPSVGQDSASPSQNLQLKNSSDGTGEISESAPVTVFASKLIETPTPNSEALGSSSLAVEQVSASEKCEGSSITGSEAADDDQDGNEECDLSLTKAEEPSETEDGEEEPLVEKECEGVTVKEESNDAEVVIDCIPLEFNTPKTRSGRATRGRRFSARRKK